MENNVGKEGSVSLMHFLKRVGKKSGGSFRRFGRWKKRWMFSKSSSSSSSSYSRLPSCSECVVLEECQSNLDNMAFFAEKKFQRPSFNNANFQRSYPGSQSFRPNTGNSWANAGNSTSGFKKPQKPGANYFCTHYVLDVPEVPNAVNQGANNNSPLISMEQYNHLLNSGATDHICPDITKFMDIKPVSEPTFITIPNGSKISVLNRGTVPLNDHIILHNVLHAPDFQFKLISVHRLCKDLQCNLVFSDEDCYVQDLSQNIQQIALGRLNSGLYTADSLQSSSCISSLSAAFTSCSSAIDQAKLWHTRMGHLLFSQLKIIQPDCDIKSCKDHIICSIFPLARQCRLPFSHSSIKTSVVLELLHIDVWGPYKVKTHSNCNQFLTIVDDYSRYTWVHLLQHKSDVPAVFANFVAYAEKQFNGKVLCVRSDNALELTEGTLKAFYLQKGIINQTTCSYTPQQNGVVEHKHRHLLETARALFFQSKVPEKYWGECIICVAYLINMMPLQSIGNLTPYFKLYKSDTSLDHIRNFGCLCYIATTKSHRTKFDLRAVPGVFLGYTSSQKGYKVLNLNNNQLLVSRDVIFYENHFPFHLSPTTTRKTSIDIG
ncbi:hypothetical protein AgCh_024661 [Apium graveolens]